MGFDVSPRSQYSFDRIEVDGTIEKTIKTLSLPISYGKHLFGVKTV